MVEVDFEIEQPKGRRVWRALKWPIVGVMLLLTWFYGLTWTIVKDTCLVCRHQTVAYQYRVLNEPVSETTTEASCLFEFILRDLGRPCPHSETESIVWCRHRGATWCPTGCHLWLTADTPDYDEAWRPKILEYATKHPEAADEFWGMLASRDREAIHEFLDQFRPNSSEERTGFSVSED